MKKIYKLLCTYFLMLIFISLFSTSSLLASSDIPFEYNIIPVEERNSIIDTKSQKNLTFKLYEPVDTIYYNDKKVQIKNNTFSINTTKLSGQTTLLFKDENNQLASFTYFFSDKSGKVDGYELVDGKDLTTYVTSYKNIKIIYTDKEKAASKKIINYLKKLPSNILKNIDTITMIPYTNTSNIAGITRDENITLYKFSKYSAATQKNILYHEIAHTLANRLMDKKIIDYSYTEYSEIVKKDKNFVSTYSKSYIEEKNKYNEDFADSFAFYFINKNSFKKKYPYRYEYISKLVKINLEEQDD